MVVRKMGWLPKHQCLVGAILHYFLNGGIQLGILQGLLAWYKQCYAAAEHLNLLDSYVTYWAFGRSGRASCQNLRILWKMLLRLMWIRSPSDIKVLQLMKGMLLLSYKNARSHKSKY